MRGFLNVTSLSILVALSCGTAPASVTIVSQWNEASGVVPTNSYSYSGSTPVSGSVSDAYAAASSAAGNFAVSAFTGGGSYGPYRAEASSTYGLSVDEPVLAVRSTGIAWCTALNDGYSADYTLKDLTSGVTLDSFSSVPGRGEYTSWDLAHAYTVDPSHSFELTMAASAGSYDGGAASMNVQLTTAIPAPSALVLGCMGAGLLHWLRRRQGQYHPV
jgi:hypothetical protein